MADPDAAPDVAQPDPLRHVDAIAERVKEQGLTIGAAESLTGGAVSSALARGAGAADWYAGSLVAYSPEVKYDVLGVTPGPLISERCAVEMARGAARVLGADAAVSTTGAGGPGSEEGQPSGTVWIGVSVRGDTWARKLHIEGDPGEVVEASTEKALGILLGALRG
jgi:nicotinamide-nucleotide amidase